MAEPFSQEESTQPSTQLAYDPGRFGKTSSGLQDIDPSDIMCILHAVSKAALGIVAATAKSEPAYILHNTALVDEATTRKSPTDIALRFSSPVKDHVQGFVFGRHKARCDINLDPSPNEDAKRVSNAHFRIFLNNAGILMIADTSTNGTIVDDHPLGTRRGKHNDLPQTRMLSNSSIVQILSPDEDELIKFIVRIPSREGFWGEYRLKFKQWMENIANQKPPVAGDGGALNAVRAIHAGPLEGGPTHRKIPVTEPLAASEYGMKWDGNGHYRCTGILGKGAFAIVYQVATTDSGQVYAAKELEKKRVMKQGRLDARLDNEMKIMKELRHPNIVQYIDYHETEQHLYIIMEYVPCGDVQGYMQKNGTLSETLAKDMSRQIFLALGYLHQKNVTHRDIKPDNILIYSESPFEVKLTDFGLSKVVTNNDTFLKTFCGTLLYCAPEVFPHYDKYVAVKGRPKRSRKDPMNKRSYSQLVDIWSYAAVLWFVLCGRPPFEGIMDTNGHAMFTRIMETSLDTTPLREHRISDSAIDLLLQMLNTDPLIRPSEAELLQHPWLCDDKDLFSPALPIYLDAIDEEGEEDVLDASQLRIHDDHLQEHAYNDSPEDANDRDVKRLRNASPTSPRLLRQEPLSPKQLNGHQPHQQVESAPRQKLFGEISGSLGEALTADASAGQLIGEYSQVSRASSDALHKSADPSLYGAEAMVRDLHMASSPSSEAAPANLHVQATSSDVGRYSSAANSYDGQITSQARPPETPKSKRFSRQIDLPLPASFFFDPYDPGTHNLEYATKVSGIDFINGEKTSKSAWEASAVGRASSSFKENQTRQMSQPNGIETFFKKSRQSLGRLTTTETSWTFIDLELTSRVSTWGRTPTNTHVYEDGNDIRVPKVAVEIWFASRNLPGTWGGERGSSEGMPTDFSLDKINSQWTQQQLAAQEDLQAMIRTQSSAGIRINGVKMPAKDAHGKRCYGIIKHGDVIEAANRGTDGSHIRFHVELYYGLGAHARRAEDKPFVVLHHDG